jgi:hypothetical protein
VPGNGPAGFGGRPSGKGPAHTGTSLLGRPYQEQRPAEGPGKAGAQGEGAQVTWMFDGGRYA